MIPFAPVVAPLRCPLDLLCSVISDPGLPKYNMSIKRSGRKIGLEASTGATFLEVFSA